MPESPRVFLTHVLVVEERSGHDVELVASTRTCSRGAIVEVGDVWLGDCAVGGGCCLRAQRNLDTTSGTRRQAYQTFRRPKRSWVNATARGSAVIIHEEVYNSGAAEAMTRDVVAMHVGVSGNGGE